MLEIYTSNYCFVFTMIFSAFVSIITADMISEVRGYKYGVL